MFRLLRNPRALTDVEPLGATTTADKLLIGSG
jgi:hypothetical protein